MAHNIDPDYEMDPLDTSATTTDFSPSPKMMAVDSGSGEDGDRIFAPLDVPLGRRLQTLAVLWHTCSIPLFSSMFFLLLSIPLLWPMLFIYMTFYYLWDKTPNNGRSFYRRSDYIRGLKIWKYYNDYFPVKIHKIADLEPTFTQQEVEVSYYAFPFNWLPKGCTAILTRAHVIKLHKKVETQEVRTGPRYIFGSHPHGVISLGITGAFATSGANFEELFPGIKIFLLTLINQFRIPFYRDYLLSMGISSVSKRNMMSLIRDHDASVCIVVGGASESLLSYPHKNDIVLRKRKGFVKIALELGDVALVPVFGFGETNLYDIYSPNPEGKFKLLYKMQWWLKKNFGFTIPLFYARGVFNYDFGLLPHRRPVNIVVGRPIHVPFRPSPSLKEINHYHDLYIKELTQIYQDHKDQFSQPEDEPLNIVQ